MLSSRLPRVLRWEWWTNCDIWPENSAFCACFKRHLIRLMCAKVSFVEGIKILIYTPSRMPFCPSLFVCLYIYLSVNLPLCPSVSLHVSALYGSICLSVSLHVSALYGSICLSVSLHVSALYRSTLICFLTKLDCMCYSELWWVHQDL